MTISIRVEPEIRRVPEATWDALSGSSDAPFLSWAFLDTLEQTGCVGEEAGWLPHHLTFWEDGELIAAAPTYLKGNSDGEFVFDHGWAAAAARAGIAYYPKLIVAVPFTPANAPRLLTAKENDRERLLPVLAEALRQIVAAEKLSSAHVLFPTEAEAKGLAEAGLAHRYGIQFHWQNRGYATFDDFLARFSSKRRNQLKRERREVERQGITMKTIRGAIDPATVDVMYTFYTTTVEKFSWGRHYLNRAFFEEICARLRGRVEIVIASEGDRPIGGAFNLAGERTLYGRYWGAIEERPFLHFNVCFYHSIEECIARKLERFEPGAGGQHKLVRGFEPTITHSAHLVAHPGLDRAVRDYLAEERRAHLENAKMSELAWR
jgi:uncharacterized protein